jgi:hypothetical protein
MRTAVRPLEMGPRVFQGSLIASRAAFALGSGRKNFMRDVRGGRRRSKKGKELRN